jgi:uncharacterized protein YukE
MLALAGLAAAACEDDEPSAEEATQALCDDLGDLEQSVSGLGGLSVNSSLSDLEDARDEIRDSLDEVRDSASDVAGAETGELEDAVDDLRNTIDDFDEDTSIADALEALAGNLRAVGDAFADLGQRVTCS